MSVYWLTAASYAKTKSVSGSLSYSEHYVHLMKMLNVVCGSGSGAQERRVLRETGHAQLGVDVCVPNCRRKETHNAKEHGTIERRTQLIITHSPHMPISAPSHSSSISNIRYVACENSIRPRIINLFSFMYILDWYAQSQQEMICTCYAGEAEESTARKSKS